MGFSKRLSSFSLHLWIVRTIQARVGSKPVFAEGRFLCAYFADHVIDADLDSAAGITALWRFLGDGVALFCIAHR